MTVKIDEFSETNLRKLGQICRGAHYINIYVRKDGKDIKVEADSLKALWIAMDHYAKCPERA